MIRHSNWDEGYTMVYDHLMLCPFKDKVNAMYFKEATTRIGVMYVLSQLIRRSTVLNSDTIEVTTSFISKYTGLPDKTVRRYLQVLKDLKIISWDKKMDRKPRWITINYETLDKMYSKYKNESGSDSIIQVEETEEVVVNDTPRTPTQNNVDVITSKIVEIMIKHNSTIDMMFIDEIQSVCGNNEQLRRECTRKAKDIIKTKNLIVNDKK